MEAIVQQVISLVATADEKAHREIVDNVRKLLFAVESPADLTHRLALGHFQLSVARLAQNTKLIEVLAKNKREPVTIEQISKEAGISPVLTERLLRYMAAMGMVDQKSDDTFAATKSTEALDTPGVRAGIGFGIDIVSHSAQAMPAFFANNGYKNPDNVMDCPWYPGHTTEMTSMQYLIANPPILAEFNTFMQYQRLNSSTWMDVYPVDLSAPLDGYSFVDIGGGVGHLCVALKERFPTIEGRIVLQEVPETINNLPAGQPFEPMVHDYFTEQPIKNAKYYYFRNIMHNLTDESCQKVLAHTKAAMGPDSKILVDDIVVPSQNCHWRIVQIDLLMMSALGAMERTEKQWNALFDGVGLKVIRTYTYDDVQGDSVLEVVPA